MTGSSARPLSPSQLSLRLDDQRPFLPRDLVDTLRPMLSRAVPAPFDSPDHLFEPRWGGLRVLAFIDGGQTRLIDRRGRDLGLAFPELANLAGQLDEQPAVLDGEIILSGPSGLADASAMDDRVAGRNVPGAVTFLVSDLLATARRLVLGEPLERRRAMLRRLLRPGGAAMLVPAVAGDGIALHRAVVDQGLDGTIARHRRSPYLPGVRSDLWRFVERGAPVGALAGHTEAPGSRPADPALDGRDAGPIVAVLSRLPLGDPSEPGGPLEHGDAAGPDRA